jgi:HEAT repeat protein
MLSAAIARATLAAAGFVWLALAAWLLVDRAIHDRRARTLRMAWRRLRPSAEDTGPTPGARTVQSLLERVPRRTIERHAADQATPIWVAQALAEHALERNPERLLRAAAGHRGERGRWRRIAALHILCRSGHADLVPFLRRALRDPDRDVAGAAVSLLGTLREPEAAALLVTALRERLQPQSRVAARLDRFPLEIAEIIAPLVRDPDRSCRFWGATLLARYGGRPGVAGALAQLAADSDPDVRKAAIESLGRLGGSTAATAAVALSRDPVWFVRAHAARALGDMKRADLASHVLPLLGDEQWWVRAAAKDALVAMGVGVGARVAALLEDGDRFVRNGASEVLQNLGLLDTVAARVADGGEDGDLDFLRKAAAAGGPALAEGILSRAAPDAAVRLRDLLGDGAPQPS